ncbi:MAG TPA: hypothetical protein VFB38_11280 [Chthonomonadaceae bacterium]|nr:hypothetical protein [Chthonomonadaceae bacterium]
MFNLDALWQDFLNCTGLTVTASSLILVAFCCVMALLIAYGVQREVVRTEAPTEEEGLDISEILLQRSSLPF